MTDTRIYQDLAEQTNGAFMLGVVGPVRSGKSTFIKKFMETLVIPRIENTYTRERARDELPQSGSGKTIMTAEPKFVPEDAVTIRLDDNAELSLRLIDSVGFMVEGASGQFEDGSERMVTTPWFDHEITMTEAAEKGTRKVMTEHSTIGIVVTTDGSFTDIPREKYGDPEARVIRELQEIGKPFVVLLNTVDPDSEEAVRLSTEICDLYGVNCLPVNCLKLDEEEIKRILQSVVEEFPLKSIGFMLPDWLDQLPDSNNLKQEIITAIRSSVENCVKIRDCRDTVNALEDMEIIRQAELDPAGVGQGVMGIRLLLPRDLYYQTISDETGIQVGSDGDLISILMEMSSVKQDYDRLKAALAEVRSRGYGVVVPDASQMVMEEPQIVRQNGKYSVKLKASAPAIHMMLTQVETEVTPAIGGESASEDIINFLLQGFDGDVNRIWESNIFGKSLNDIAEEGLVAKLESLPENAKRKLRETLERIVNEGSSGLICILL